MNEKSITVELTQQQDYRFDINFGAGIPVLTGDEPAPLGTGQGPSPVQLLCAAVGNCLSDSMLFACASSSRHPTRFAAAYKPVSDAMPTPACACSR